MQPLRTYPLWLFCVALALAPELGAQTPVFSVPVAPPSSITPTPASTYSPAAPSFTATVSVLTPGAGSAPGLIVRTFNDPAWNSAGVTTAPATGTHPARLINLSARAQVGSGTDTLIAGAGVTGTGTLPILVRGIGPGLRPFGVTNAIAYAPTLTVYRDTSIAAQTNVMDPAATQLAALVGAFPGQSSDDVYATGDAALVGKIAAGTLTAHCTAQPDDSGLGMVEFYDAGSGAGTGDAHFVNFSARSTIGSGANVLIVGFVVQGEGSTSLLLRASGRSLEQFGVTNPLADPVLELYSGNTLLTTNDDWQQSDATGIKRAGDSVAAFPLTSAKDSALLVTLTPGAYTLHVRSGSPSTTGVALAEIYTVSAAPTFDAATAVNALGLDLFQQLKAQPGNLIISPYSIETAFALAYAGAAGDTRSEMARVLRFPADNLSLVSGLGTLRTALDKMAADSITLAARLSVNGATYDPIQWQVANRVFGQTGFPFRSSYLTLLNDSFNAPLQSLDFVGAPEPSRLTINDWVAGVTHDRIQNLLPSGAVDRGTRVILVNALYLKAPWITAFEKSLTTTQPFHLADGTSADAAMMIRTDNLGYAARDTYAVAALPYLGSDLQFVIVLPNAGISVDAVAASLTTAEAESWSNLSLTDTRVSLWLPKFKIAGDTLALAKTLIDLGMGNAFGVPLGSADFDGIAPRDSSYLKIQQVYHKTFVAIDEQGTEAAAATAIGMATTSIGSPALDPIEFRVDRPFLFAIQQRETGALLFLGRIDDPTQ